MNEDHKRRGFAYSKTLMTAAICALFLGGGENMGSIFSGKLLLCQ